MNPARNKEKKSRPQPPPKLSETLRGLLRTEGEDHPLTVNYLLNNTAGQGIFLTVILLALPFMVPLLPGMSTPFGAAIIYLAWTQMGGKRKGLPAWLGDRPIPKEKFFKIIESTSRILRFIEGGFKPRFSWWLLPPGIQTFHWFLIAFLAFLLALPIPLPASNTFPAFALVFTTAALMERDGIMVWLGYFFSLLSVVWIGMFIFLGDKLLEYLSDWFYRIFIAPFFL